MALVDLFSEQEQRSVVSRCSSMAQLLKELGYGTVHGNQSITVKRRLEKYGISTDHFNSSQCRSNRSTENVFVKNSTANQTTLRRWYIKGNYSEYKCAICGQDPIWNGRDLVLTLDHTDGNNSNNVLSNLRWLCPNCHSQTRTFAGKNVVHEHKSPRLCLECGVTISSGSTFCLRCFHKRRRKVVRPSPEELLIEQKDSTFEKVGYKYGVSGNAVRKWCKPYQISGKPE